MVELDKVKKSYKRDVMLCIRTTKQNKTFIDKNQISPTKLFNEILEELKNRK